MQTKDNIITLCWLPPAKTYLPSPAMTVLKQVLQENGYKTQIIYWNILLEEVFLKYFFNDKRPLNDDIATLGPFFSYIAMEQNDTDSLIKQELYLRVLKPQYAGKNIDFQKHIRDCVSDLKSAIARICQEYDVGESSFVGMSMSLFQWVPAYVIGSVIKEMYPDSFITVGGIGNPEQAKAYISSFKYIDLASWGEGENFIIGLANRLSNDEDLSTLPQCYIRNGHEFVKNAAIKKDYWDLDKLPYYDFSDFFNSYNGKLKDVMIPIEGARGCHWNRCHFCFLNQGYKYRHKSIDCIKEELLQNIRRYSVYDFTFLDNDIIGKDKEKFHLLLDKLIEIKSIYPKFRIMLAEIITRGIDYDTIKKMHIAGFAHVQIGYESPSDVLLHKIDKKNSFASNLFFIKWANEFNIDVGGMNILRGLLEENIEDIKEGVQNLHFMRFYQIGAKYKHEISSLAINSASRYYKGVDKQEIKLSYSDTVKEMLPDNFLLYDDGINIYQYVRRFQVPEWKYFIKMEGFYAKKHFSYELVRCSDKTIRYTEYYNAVPIRVIDFIESDIAWRILNLSNKNIMTTEKISKCLGSDYDTIINEVGTLRDIGLLYVGKHSEECVSIINTLKIL